MKREEGFALIGVILLLATAGLIAGSVLLASRSDLGVAEAIARQNRGEAAARSAVALACADLLDATRVKKGPSLNGDRPATYRIANTEATVWAVAEDGLLNVNSADPNEISSVLRAVTGSASTAEKAARKISDMRRDSVTFTRPIELLSALGAETDDLGDALPFLTARAKGDINTAHVPAGLRSMLPRLRAEAPAGRNEQPLAIAAFPGIVFFVDLSTASHAQYHSVMIANVSPNGDLRVFEHRPVGAGYHDALLRASGAGDDS